MRSWRTGPRGLADPAHRHRRLAVDAHQEAAERAALDLDRVAAAWQTVRGVVGGAAPVETQGPQGFGYEDVRSQDPARFQPRPGQLQEIHPRVAAVSQREPGIYVVQLDDGAQWLFAEGVSSQFRLPGRGDTVEIGRGSLGSFLMRVDGQSPVPVRRIR